MLAIMLAILAPIRSACPPRLGHNNWLSRRPRIGTSWLTQEKILEDKVSIAARKWRTANAAGYLGIDGFRPGLGFDQVIQRVATRAVEMICRHSSPRVLPNKAS